MNERHLRHKYYIVSFDDRSNMKYIKVNFYFDKVNKLNLTTNYLKLIINNKATYCLISIILYTF